MTKQNFISSYGGTALPYTMQNSSGCYACFNGVKFVKRDKAGGIVTLYNPSCKENRPDLLKDDVAGVATGIFMSEMFRAMEPV